MTEVLLKIDSRAYPIELAKSLLQLAPELQMNKGPTAYHEAEVRMMVLLDALTTYFKIAWPENWTGQDFSKYRATVERFIGLKQYSPMLKQSVARQLLDCIHYFPTAPVAEPIYLEVLDESERTNH